MAAIVGHYNFWNLTSEKALRDAWLHLENVNSLSLTSFVLSIVMAPIIVLGNVLVLLAVWKDPLKKLRLAPSNFILVSMAVADLSVGLVVCPITAYWGWVIFDKGTSVFELSVIFAINVFSVNVSFGHMFLLTVDRLLAVVKPLQYRVIITNKRAVIASCICWIYFLAFGCSFLMLRDYFAIMGALDNVQLLAILVSMLIMYSVIMIRFHRYSKTRLNKLFHSRKSLLLIVKRERNLFKAITIVICAFLICYLPSFIGLILIYLCKPCHSHLASFMTFFGFSTCLTHLNSGLNPILYSWRLPKYRETFKYLWKKKASMLTGQKNKKSSENVYNTKL